MSDLSRLLGDVYNQDAPAAAPASGGADGPEGTGDTADPRRGGGDAAGALPEWADEGVLDEAFASWVPGPPPDAPVAERTMLTDIAGGPDEPSRDDADRAAPHGTPAPTEPDREAGAAAPVPVAPVADPLPEWRGGWQRSDDDILPGRTKGGLFRR